MYKLMQVGQFTTRCYRNAMFRQKKKKVGHQRLKLSRKGKVLCHPPKSPKKEEVGRKPPRLLKKEEKVGLKRDENQGDFIRMKKSLLREASL